MSRVEAKVAVVNSYSRGHIYNLYNLYNTLLEVDH